MLKVNYPKIENKKFTDLEFSLLEPSYKINLRGKNREFFTRVCKILSLMLPTESNTCSTIKNINALWLSPDEWMIVSNEKVQKDSNMYELEEILYNSISKTNLGAVTDVTDQLVLLELKGENIFELFASGSPFNFNEFKEKKGSTTQTLLNNIDVIIHHKDENLVNLFVRRSFSEHLCSWINDSASRL